MAARSCNGPRLPGSSCHRTSPTHPPPSPLLSPGLQHLHPFLSLVRGYHRGLSRAFGWTASLLAALVPARLRRLGAGGAAAARFASLAHMLPVLAHGLFRALA